jgi:Domain of unknown function (DUF4342)
MAMEEFKVNGAKVVEKVKALVHEGNVRRVILKNAQGRVLLDMPLNAGLVGMALLPFWTTVATIVVAASDYTIAIERDRDDAVAKPKPAS